MTQEKLKKLEVYLSKQKDRLDSPIPNKHLTRPEQFKAFLRKEISEAKSRIDRVKLGDK